MPCPQLPSELWLEILSHCSPHDLWLFLRNTSKQLRACSEDTIKNDTLHGFTINQTFSLGAGTRHHWYDVRGSIILSFSSLSKHNSQYALFNNITYHPEPCYHRVWEKWNQICSAGVGENLEWKVQLNGGEVRRMKLSKLVISGDHGVWCDWREMMNGYFGGSSV